MPDDIFGHPDAVVAHPQADVSAGAKPGTSRRVRLVNQGVLRADGEDASVGHGIARVHRKIDQDLLHLAGVRHDRPQFAPEIGAQLYVLTQRSPKELIDIADHLVQAHGLGPHDLTTAECE